LSGGMQKRLDIACALINDPAILILDEPTADLDPVLRKQLWDLIRQINAKGTTILLASHFLTEVELLCTRIAILQDGAVREQGTAEELRNLYSTQYEFGLQTYSQEYKRLLGELSHVKKFWSKAGVEDGELVIETAAPEGLLAFLAGRVRKGELQSLHVTRPTLGRVFEQLVNNKGVIK
ncbi:MAG TPA: ATP-binding cassette domain-containing protein, partial [Candidatus Nanoarchaeia archaeon]|nr:ATP-binding cassette domain-containing protein [Candidatus Nanoarchaeia archaeon]